MRIALFSDTFFPQVNGVVNTVDRMARAFAAAGHTVRVYAASPSTTEELGAKTGSVYSVFRVPSVPALVYEGERIALPNRSLLRDLRDFNPDILHTHTPFGVGRQAVHAARALGRPLVGTHHTFFDQYLKHIHLDFPVVRRLTWRLTVAYYNQCTVVVSPTRSLRDGLLQYGLRREVAIIPNMVDTSLFTPVPAEARASRPTLLYLGRLSYEKSVDDVLRAFRFIRQELDADLLIVGDGPERTALEQLADSLKIRSHTRFTGFLHGEELLRTIEGASVFISASKSENMPLVVLEVLALGIPVVAVDSLGMGEMLQPGENAILTPPDDPAALAQAALTLLTDLARLERYRQAARTASLAFSPEHITQRFLALYESAIEATPHTPAPVSLHSR